MNFLNTRTSWGRTILGATAALMVAATASCGAATSTSDSNAGNKDVAVGGEAWLVGEGAARDPLGKSGNW